MEGMIGFNSESSDEELLWQAIKNELNTHTTGTLPRILDFLILSS